MTRPFIPAFNPISYAEQLPLNNLHAKKTTKVEMFPGISKCIFVYQNVTRWQYIPVFLKGSKINFCKDNKNKLIY